MRITIPDALIPQLEPFLSPTRTIDDLVAIAVQRIGKVGPQARHIVLTEEDINLLENRLATPALGTAADLHRAVDELAEISLGKIAFRFTPNQLREIEARAARESQTPAEIIQKILYAMFPQFFAVVPVEPPQLVTKGR